MELNESIISSLAELDSLAAKQKLIGYAEAIKKSILSMDNSQRHKNLTVLEKFSYRIGKEALEVIALFMDSKRSTVKPTKVPIRQAYKNAYVLEKCLDILNQYDVRYGEFDKSFLLLLKFYTYENDNSEYAGIRKRAKSILLDMANYNLKIIRPKNVGFVGYHYQNLILKEIKSLIKMKDKVYFDLTIDLIRKLFETEAEGSYWDRKSVTMERMPLIASPGLIKIRKELITDTIKRIKSEKDTHRKIRLIGALQNATNYPIQGSNNALELLIMKNTLSILSFYKTLEVEKENPAVIQEMNGQLNWFKRRFKEYKGDNKTTGLSIFKKADIIQVSLKKNKFYNLYCLLVHGTREDFFEDGGFEKAQERSRKALDELVEEIRKGSINYWVQRLKKIIKIYPLKQDFEFTNLRFVLREISLRDPIVAEKIYMQLSVDKFISKSFLTQILMGIKASDKGHIADRQVNIWLNSKDPVSIKEIPFVYALMENRPISAKDQIVFEKLLKLKIADKDRVDLDLTILSYLPFIFKNNYARLNALVIVILKRLPTESLDRFSSIIGMAHFRGQIDLAKVQKRLDKALITKYILKEQLTYEDETILATLAQKNLIDLIDFFEKRFKYKKQRKQDPYTDRYDAMPYHLGDIAKSIVKSSQYNKVLRRVFDKWLLGKDGLLAYEGAQFLHEISPNLDLEVKAILLENIKTGDKNKVMAVISLLKEYDGSNLVDDLCQEIVKRYSDKETLNSVFLALYTTGGVWGEYGFYNAHKERRDRVAQWKHHNNKRLKSFIEQFDKDMTKVMEQEKKEVENRELLGQKGIDVL